MLYENNLCSISATARSHSGHECFAEKTRSGCSPFIHDKTAISPPKRSAVSSREFIAKVKEEALGQEVMTQLSPGQA
ncbi:hypothetical protein RFX65_06595, partial [Acinetobacter baumannii]|nr:hypothetical protein [Acinetobacter baumannii]